MMVTHNASVANEYRCGDNVTLKGIMPTALVISSTLLTHLVTEALS